MKNEKVIAFISALIFSVIFSLLFKWGQKGNPFKAETIMYGTVIFLNILILGWIAQGIFRKYSKKTSTEFKKNIIPYFILFVFIALIISLTLVSVGVYSFYLLNGWDTTNFLSHLFTVELTSALKQFSIWILFGSVFFFYIIWRKAIEREQLLVEENLKYKYKTLKSQVNPHFLFNSLNTLSELVYVDSKKADNYIQKLSAIYRYVLENEETKLIPIKEEIKFVREYFSLQKERDQDKISLEINMDEAKDYKIIPVSLQLLVENALKHNSMSRKNPLKINITINDDYIVVSNNIQRKSIMNSSTNIGLLNLTERVRLIMNKKLIIKEENNMFIVKLPIIK